MARKVECSNCHKRYLVDEALIGKQFKCKMCGEVFEIPEVPDDLLDLIRADEPVKKKKKKKKKS
ncbi:MAG: hypothetical protein AB7K09_05210 [Planctomycetota bacterium]